MRILRVRLWEFGHSFEEIDEMNIQDMGDIIAYWSEKNKIERKQARDRQNKNKNKGK